MLGEVSDNVLQICVLTHNRDFMHRAARTFGDCKTLQLEPDGAGGSRLSEYDLAKEARTSHQKRIEDLKDYCKAPTESGANRVVSEVRQLFDHVVTVKYHHCLPKEAYGIGTGTLINKCVEIGRMDEGIAKEIKRVIKLSHKKNHNEESTESFTSVSGHEAAAMIRDAFELLDKV